MFEAFQLGPFLFRTHILFLLIGVWLATELFLRTAMSENMRTTIFVRKAIWFFIAFLIGGRLLGMILFYRIYVQDPLRILVIWDGIFSVVGGCAGIAITIFVMTWDQRAVFLRWMDTLLPSIILLIAFDWIGKFFGSLSYGKPTDVLWGVAYNSIQVRYTVPVHPVQLYYAFWFFGLTVLLLILRKGGSNSPKSSYIGIPKFAVQNVKPGLITLVGIILGCLAVIFFEFMRGDFAVMVFAKFSDFLFLVLLFASLGMLSFYERKISHKYSMVNSALLGIGTVLYLVVRPMINIASVEWRFSQFLAVLVILSTIVYVVIHRWKYPRL